MFATPDKKAEISAASPPLALAGVRGAMVQLGCDTLMPTLDFFTQRLGFRIETIFPADNPQTSLVGITLQLSAGVANAAPRLTLLCDDPMVVSGGLRQLVAPNGTVVRFAQADPGYKLLPMVQALMVSQSGESTHWTVGRAGLRYRDLLPDRHGGAFIASHIRVLDGGPVPDYVHYHKVPFQMIFCRAGWARVLYEGQGEAIPMQAGDCVLQPPLIRHQVIESSVGAEVIEIGTPAVDAVAPAGFEHQDTGIGTATNGLAGVRVVRPLPGDRAAWPQQHDTEFCFYFVRSGSVEVVHEDGSVQLAADGSITLPGGLPYRFATVSPDLALLEVTLPDAVALTVPVN